MGWDGVGSRRRIPGVFYLFISGVSYNLDSIILHILSCSWSFDVVTETGLREWFGCLIGGEYYVC